MKVKYDENVVIIYSISLNKLVLFCDMNYSVS
jgi:hypothetical protein